MSTSSASRWTAEEQGQRSAIRVLNAAGRALERVGVRPFSLSEESLIRAAERKSGLSGWGGDGFREPLRRLIASLEADADLSLVGRRAERDDLVRLLCNRLRIQDALERHPEISDVSIERPMFVTGFPRTGSTLLHNLLALDPRTRTPLLWELLSPAPPPDPATAASDPRIGEATRYLRNLEFVAPQIRTIHAMDAMAPEECRFLIESSFVGPQFLLYYHVPGYWEWFRSLPKEDLLETYRYYRTQVQLLLWRYGGRRWLSKTAVHSFFFDELIQVFPDACVVQLHRDPVASIPSLCSLAQSFRSIVTDRVDREELGRTAVALFRLGIGNIMRAREAGDPSRFFDVHYDDLVADPTTTVRRIHEHFDLEVDPALEARLKSYVQENPQHKHGRHHYSLEQFGLTREQLLRETEPYRAWLGSLER